MAEIQAGFKWHSMDIGGPNEAVGRFRQNWSISSSGKAEGELKKSNKRHVEDLMSSNWVLREELRKSRESNNRLKLFISETMEYRPMHDNGAIARRGDVR